MQMQEAAELKMKWGDKSCSHKLLAKEYYLGSETGDYVCKKCGRSGWGLDWPMKESKNNMPNIVDSKVMNQVKIANKRKFIEVEPYGRYGNKPREKDLCPYSGSYSCESSDGNSLCGCNHGYKTIDDKTYVTCEHQT